MPDRLAPDRRARTGRRRPREGGAAVHRRDRRRGRPGLRQQPARLGAVRRRPGAGRRVPRRLRRARRAGVHPRVAAGQPRLTDRGDGDALGRDARARAAPGAPRSARAVSSSTPAARSTPITHRQRVPAGPRGAAAAARRRDGGRRAAAAGRAERRRRPVDGGPGRGPRRLLRRRRPAPVARRLPRHLPRLGGRARPRDARRHDRDAGHARRDVCGAGPARS